MQGSVPTVATLPALPYWVPDTNQQLLTDFSASFRQGHPGSSGPILSRPEQRPPPHCERRAPALAGWGLTVPWRSSYRQGLHRSCLTASWPTSHPSRPLHSCAQAPLSLPLPPTLTSASGIPRPSLTNSVILPRFLGIL